MDRVRAPVSTVLEFVEELAQQRVLDRSAIGVELEVTFGHVRHVLGSVDQDVIPGPVLRWPRASDLFVPLLGSGEDGVHVDDHAAVIETLVANHLTQPKASLGITHLVLLGRRATVRRVDCVRAPKDGIHAKNCIDIVIHCVTLEYMSEPTHDRDHDRDENSPGATADTHQEEPQRRERSARQDSRRREKDAARDTRRRQRDWRRARKERVIHTRVSDELAGDIRRLAEDLRVPASNLVRNVLEEVFTVVETVSEDVGELFEDLIDEAEEARDRILWRVEQRRERARRRQHSSPERHEDVEAELSRDERKEAEAASSPRPEFPEVLGWQPLVLNREQDCADCGRTQLGGARAFVGLTETGMSRTTLCRDCMDARSR